MSNHDEAPENRLRKELPEEMPVGAAEAVDNVSRPRTAPRGSRATSLVGSGS